MQWRRVSATLVALVVVASCRSDAGDDGPELGLDDGADVEVEPDDASSAEDDADGSSAEDDPLYPPLPPLEPDPTSDIPVALQQEILDLHAEVYAVTQRALATGEFEEQQLRGLLAGELLEATLDSFAERQREGIVEISPDTTVPWVRVVEGGGGPVTVHECRLVGPMTGDVDRDGERISSAERDGVVPLVFELVYSVVEVDDDTVGYRLTNNTRLDGAEGCGA